MKKLVLTVFIKNKEYSNALVRGLSMESPGIEVREAHSLREAQVCGLYGILITDREAYGTFAVTIEKCSQSPLSYILRAREYSLAWEKAIRPGYGKFFL